MDINEIARNNIKTLCDLQGVPVTRLDAKGINNKTAYNFITGRSNISLHKLEKIAIRFNTSVLKLVLE
jgi:hypothetical protein